MGDRDYDAESRTADVLKDVWAHLTLLATGQPSLDSNAALADRVAQAYEDLMGEPVQGEGESDSPDLSGAELWADGSRGIYIPQFFAQGIERKHLSGVTDEDLAVLDAGPEHEQYWDAWATVLDNAVLTDNNGKRWSLYQDGDLWVVPMKEPDTFTGWCDWVSGGKHDKPSEWPDRDTIEEQIDKAHRRGAINDETAKKLADYFYFRVPPPHPHNVPNE